MSVNDPDGPLEEPLTREEFLELLIRNGWNKEVAEIEWEQFDKPVYPSALEW